MGKTYANWPYFRWNISDGKSCEPMPKQPTNDNASYFQFDVMREAFNRWVDEDKVPEDQWRPRATKLVRIVQAMTTSTPTWSNGSYAKSPGAVRWHPTPFRKDRRHVSLIS